MSWLPTLQIKVKKRARRSKESASHGENLKFHTETLSQMATMSIAANSNVWIANILGRRRSVAVRCQAIINVSNGKPGASNIIDTARSGRHASLQRPDQ